ncbi:MAG: ATP-binding cassette domain-containing protein [Candidatus Didemnitutus sp.]|nr:ATP-binding cassette domain-containing protein [Candidatus Didemnitutus sp.]
MPSPQPLLFDFRQLTVYRGERRVLHRLDLQLKNGEHIALLGPNGCGKSTLLKTLTRELYPVADTPGFRFQVLGTEWCDITDFRQKLGVVALDQLQQLSHEVTVRSVTGLDLVLSGYFGSLGLWPHLHPSPTQRRRARGLMRFLEIAHLAARPVAQMSSGEQRRMLIARALVHDPAALLLDEPTSSLDPGATDEFRQVLRKLAQRGKSLILVTHTVADIVPEIERVILMAHGAVVADGPTQRVLTSRSLSQLFGTRLRLTQRNGRYHLTASSEAQRGQKKRRGLLRGV